MNSPKVLPFSQLNATHPEYNELEVQKLQLLYEGGAAIEQNASIFIHREIMEGNDAIYRSRLKCVSYRNYFAGVVNDYISGLFAKSFSIMPAGDAEDESTPGEGIDHESEADDFYQDFAADTDLKGHTLSDVLSKVMIEAVTTGRAYIGVDFPKPSIQVQNRAEEIEHGLSRAYTICLPTLSVIDWDIDEYGKFKYVILKNVIFPVQSFYQKRTTKVTQFKVWEKDQDTGLVTFKIYEITTKVNKEPKKDDPCTLVDEGEVSFKDIPVLCMDVPTQLWIGGLIGSLCAEHFRRSSSLVHAMNRNCFSIPFYQQGPEIEGSNAGGKAPLNTASQNPNRGQDNLVAMRAKGFAVGAKGDALSFVEPQGNAYTIIDTQLKELVDAIKDITKVMGTTVSSATKGVARSGASKQMDNHSKELVLTSYAILVKQFAVALYNLVSGGRNEDIIWTAKGMTDFKIVDRDSLIQEITQNQLTKQAVPSRTFYKLESCRLAGELNVNLSPAEQLTIQKEITEHFDKLSDEELNPKPIPPIAPIPEDKKPLQKQEDKLSNKNSIGNK